jgi:hypothetical protein
MSVGDRGRITPGRKSRRIAHARVDIGDRN